MLSRAQIRDRWGPLLAGFEPAPPGHPIAAGLPAGTVTDDTEQAVLLARLLIKGNGTIDPSELAIALVDWEQDMAERGSLDLLGPSTKRAVAAVLAGVPPRGSRFRRRHQRRRHAHNPCGHRLVPPPPRPSCQAVDAGRPCGDGEQRHPQHRDRAGGRRGRGRRGERGRLRRRDSRGHGAGHPGRADRGLPRSLGGGRGRRGAHRVGHRPGRGPGRGRSRRAHLRPGRHQPGHPGVRAGRVRGAGRGARRSVAGLPAGRLARRRLRHDRGDGRRDRRRLPRRRLPPGRGHRGRRRPGPRARRAR